MALQQRLGLGLAVAMCSYLQVLPSLSHMAPAAVPHLTRPSFRHSVTVHLLRQPAVMAWTPPVRPQGLRQGQQPGQGQQGQQRAWQHAAVEAQPLLMLLAPP